MPSWLKWAPVAWKWIQPRIPTIVGIFSAVAEVWKKRKDANPEAK